jgi:hypothetical protein
MAASIRSWRNAAGKVVVSEWPCGTLAVSLLPRGARPRKLAMLVLVQVSSMKTKRSDFDPALILRPLRAPAGHVRTLGFAGDDAFF